MKLDFTSRPPQTSSLEEAQSIIDAAWNAYGDLLSQNLNTKKKLSAKKEKLNTSSKNSSLPPSGVGSR